MSQNLLYYASTLLVYGGVAIIASWALNLEFGDAGIPNFGFVVFQAAGGYTQGVLTLGPDTGNGGFQHYVGGADWPFPLPILAAAGVGAILSGVVGAVTMLRLRRDFQALVLLVFAIMAVSFVTDDVKFLNGASGLSLIPQPLSSVLPVSAMSYQWSYVGLTVLICLICFGFLHRFTESPLGRAIRATRDNESAATALGKNVFSLRILTMMVGGGMAAVSGAVLVGFIGVWAPGGWAYQESLVYFGAVIVGGVGNRIGVAVGAVLLPVVFSEASRFLPVFGRVGMVDALQWVAIALLILAFLWFWPMGLVPERPRSPGLRRSRRRDPSATPALTRLMTATDLHVRAQSAAGPSTPILMLEVRDVHCSFGGVRAVDGTSFGAMSGQITGLIGPNGAGKSTVVSVVAGAIKPATGSISFDGRNVTGLAPYKRARLGLVRTYQLPSEFSRLTVLENLLVATTSRAAESLHAALIGPRAWGDVEDEMITRAREWLRQFRMADKEGAYAGALSGGEKRLVEIMRGLMMKPKLLLLDEPFAGVSPHLAAKIAGYLSDLRSGGLTIVMVEHELRMVERLCDRVIVMAQGRVISQGSMHDIRQSQDVRNAYVNG